MPKICKACSTENADERNYCKKCFAELPVSSGPAPAAPMVPQAPPQNTQPGGQPPTMAPPRRQYQETTYLADPEPVEKPPSPVPWGWIVVLFLVIVGGLVYKFVANAPLPEPKIKADAVVTSFLEAKQTGDYAKVKPFLSKESIELIDKAFSTKQAQSAGFGAQDAQEMMLFGVEPTRKTLKFSDILVVRRDDPEQPRGTATVRLSVTPKKTAFRIIDIGTIDYFYVLVLDGDQWKIDLKKSDKRTGIDRKTLPGLK